MSGCILASLSPMCNFVFFSSFCSLFALHNQLCTERFSVWTLNKLFRVTATVVRAVVHLWLSCLVVYFHHLPRIAFCVFSVCSCLCSACVLFVLAFTTDSLIHTHHTHTQLDTLFIHRMETHTHNFDQILYGDNRVRECVIDSLCVLDTVFIHLHTHNFDHIWYSVTIQVTTDLP